VKVLFYGRLADAIAADLEIHAPAGSSIAELRRTLARSHPHAAEVLMSKRARALVADALVDENFVPRSGDQVEFLPPVSGG
jgi:molybdopterin converting factor small subunit